MARQTNIHPIDEVFIGRGRECTNLEKALGDGERLISIIGPSGMGKTRFARQMALRIVPQLDGEGGVWFCDLSAARTRDDLLSAVAVILGIPRSGEWRQDGGVPPLAHAIANRGSLLLVLDNFEYLEAGAVGLLSDWLGHAPQLQLIVTSLVRLGIEGESLFELGPLTEEEAVELYVERANRAWSGKRGFASGERRAVEELVHRLDCLPLAIELAAARVRALPPRAMLSQIEDRFELLRTRRTGRHSSLEYAIQCSWDLLEPVERLTLARASIFVGGFTLEAGEHVLAADDASVEILEVLEELRDKALLQLDTSNPPRFSLYESLRVFAERELEKMGKAEEVARRHTSYFLEQGERWAGESSGPNGPAAIERLVADRENLIAVHRRQRDAEPALAARAGLAASVALARVGSPFAEQALVDGAVAAARQSNEPLLLARALRVRLVMLRRFGRLPDSRQDLEEALALAQRLGDRSLEAYLWSDSGGFRWHQGEFDEAADDLARALEIAGEVGDPALVGHLRLNLGVLADFRGLSDEARTCFEEARDIFQRIGDLRSQARALVSLGHLPTVDGELGEARVALAEARRLFHVAADRSAEADVLLALGNLELSAGRLDEAAAYLGAALPIQRNLGNRRWEGLALATLGMLSMEREEHQLAKQRLEEGLLIIRSTGDHLLAVPILPYLAAVSAILGQLDEATLYFAEARSAFEGQGDPSGLAMVDIFEGFLDLARARLAAQGSRADEAASFVERALQRRDEPRSELPPSHEIPQALRLLEKALARYVDLAAGGEQAQGVGWGAIQAMGAIEPQDRLQAAAVEAATAPGDGSESGSSLIVGPDAAWFEVPGRPRVPLFRSTTQRRLLQVLVEHRLLAPGVGLSLEQLSAFAWPGEELDSLLASNRVYSAVSTLRKAGLAELLLRHADGYLLAPDLEIHRVRS